MLRMIGYGDTAGSGFPTILAAWAEKGWPEPELVEDTILNQVTLKLYMNTKKQVESTPTSTPTSTPKSTASSTDVQRRELITDCIKADPYISKKDISEKTGRTLYAVKKEIGIMKEEGIIEYIGSSRKGYWTIKG